MVLTYKLTVTKGASSIFFDNQGFQFGRGGDHRMTFFGIGLDLLSGIILLEISDNVVSELTSILSLKKYEKIYTSI